MSRFIPSSARLCAPVEEISLDLAWPGWIYLVSQEIIISPKSQEHNSRRAFTTPHILHKHPHKTPQSSPIVAKEIYLSFPPENPSTSNIQIITSLIREQTDQLSNYKLWEDLEPRQPS